MYVQSAQGIVHLLRFALWPSVANGTWGPWDQVCIGTHLLCIKLQTASLLINKQGRTLSKYMFLGDMSHLLMNQKEPNYVT